VLLVRQFILAAIVPRSRPLLSGGDYGLRRAIRDATCGTIQAKEESMRAETQNLVEEIKQSVRLLRRHL
jgi:hypothetical protein